MDFRRRFIWSFALPLFAIFLSLSCDATVSLASTGTIDATNHYAWSDNGGYVNWYATGGNVIVTDTSLTGYIWSASFGWINLSPTLGGVTNNAGVLGGYAWGANTGWISFAGVTIDSNGLFHGQTTAQSLFGTMTFDCTYCNVTTSWRNSTVTPTVTNTGGGGVISGSQSVGYQNGSGASSSAAVPTTSPGSSSNANLPKSLTPTAPPPKTEPTVAPGNSSPPAHLTPSITLSIYTAPSAVAGSPLAVNVNFSNTTRTHNITMAYRLYSSAGKTVYSAPATLTPTSGSSFTVSIPTAGLPEGTYTVAVSAQYGKQAIATQTLTVGLYADKAQAASASSTYMQTTTPSCSWLTCWWQRIVSFFTHLF
jgi:hypothetical protein